MNTRRQTTVTVAWLITVVLGLPTASFAQVKVIISGGFAAAYREVLPDFERTTGITVTTTSGASQGSGPEVIGNQLRRGVKADVVILSKEGLADLIADSRILAGSSIDLAQTPIGMAMRSGALKPEIGTVDAFTQTLLRAKSIALPGSTTGIYLTTKIFPRLGITDKVVVKVTSRGAESVAMVANGDADYAVQPLSEILNERGVELVGTIPAEIQYVSVFSAAIVAGSTELEASKRLIAFLSSDIALAAMKRAGMERSKPR